MCTHINIKSSDNNYYWGRTLDTIFNPFDVDSRISIVPKNFVLETETNPWKTKYSFMGINLCNSTLFLDGINEKGLIGGLLFLKACTWDTKENIIKDGLTPINSGEFVTYALSNFKSIQEIKENIDKFAVTSDDITSLGELGKNSPITAHYTFMDKTGASVVLEPTNNGKFRVFENLTGVMANDPTYDWHMTNLSNYVQIKGYDRTKIKLNENLDVEPILHGSGLLGLPGDYTSPSRFVRAVYLRNLMDKVDDKQSVAQLFSVLNSLWIPKGVEGLKEGSNESDFSSYVCVYDQNSSKLYLRIFDRIETLEFSLDNMKQNEVVSYCVN